MRSWQRTSDIDRIYTVLHHVRLVNRHCCYYYRHRYLRYYSDATDDGGQPTLSELTVAVVGVEVVRLRWDHTVMKIWRLCYVQYI